MRTSQDKALRQHLLYVLRGGGAHAMFDDVIGDFPAKLRGQRVDGLSYTAWMLLEHMRIAQCDILEFSRNLKHISPEWPARHWPKTDAPPNAAVWTNSIKRFRKDRKTMETLISNPKIDLYAPIPWGDGQTVLREALLVADHNSYHLGQLVTLRRLLGAWNLP